MRSPSILTYALQLLAYLLLRRVHGRHELRALVYDFHIGYLSDFVCCAKGLCVVDVDEHKRARVCELCLQLLELRMHCLARRAPAGRKLAQDRPTDAVEFVLTRNCAHLGTGQPL